MDPISGKLAERIALVFLVAAAGYAARRRSLIDASGIDSAVRLLMGVTFPCFAVHSMLTKVDPAAVGANLTVAAVGFLMFLAGYLLGRVAVLPTGLAEPSRGTFVHLLTANNYVYLPLPILLGVWPGQTGTGVLIMIGAGLAFWTVGIYPLVRHLPLRERVGQLLNPPFLAVIAGLAGSLLGLPALFERPGLKSLLGAMELAGQATIPLALLLVGAILAGSTNRAPRRLLLWYCALRLVIFPLLFLPVLHLARVGAETTGALLLISMMPAANTSTLVARRFGGDAELASAANLWSTLLAALSVPLLFPVFARLLGI